MLDALREVARAVERSPAQVAVDRETRRPGVTSTIIGATKMATARLALMFHGYDASAQSPHLLGIESECAHSVDKAAPRQPTIAACLMQIGPPPSFQGWPLVTASKGPLKLIVAARRWGEHAWYRVTVTGPGALTRDILRMFSQAGISNTFNNGHHFSSLGMLVRRADGDWETVQPLPLEKVFEISVEAVIRVQARPDAAETVSLRADVSSLSQKLQALERGASTGSRK